jgi:hypothetical protein
MDRHREHEFWFCARSGCRVQPSVTRQIRRGELDGAFRILAPCHRRGSLFDSVDLFEQLRS